MAGLLLGAMLPFVFSALNECSGKGSNEYDWRS
jgi:Na+/H+-translocating membrane pyrophosphatase